MMRGEVGVEMVLPWHSLLCIDFSLFLFAKWGPVSHLSFVNSLRAAFYHNFCQTLSVDLNQSPFFVMLVCHFINGLVFTKKSCKHTLEWSNERMWGKSPHVLFPFQKGKRSKNILFEVIWLFKTPQQLNDSPLIHPSEMGVPEPSFSRCLSED